MSLKKKPRNVVKVFKIEDIPDACGVGACAHPATREVKYVLGPLAVDMTIGLCEAHARTVKRDVFFIPGGTIDSVLNELYAHGLRPSVTEIKVEISKNGAVLRTL